MAVDDGNAPPIWTRTRLSCAWTAVVLITATDNAAGPLEQALRAATIDAARCMRIDRDLGTLEAGKWADFVVLDASPLERISNVRRIRSVWIAGNRVGQ